MTKFSITGDSLLKVRCNGSEAVVEIVPPDWKSVTLMTNFNDLRTSESVKRKVYYEYPRVHARIILKCVPIK